MQYWLEDCREQIYLQIISLNAFDEEKAVGIPGAVENVLAWRTVKFHTGRLLCASHSPALSRISFDKNIAWISIIPLEMGRDLVKSLSASGLLHLKAEYCILLPTFCRKKKLEIL